MNPHLYLPPFFLIGAGQTLVAPATYERVKWDPFPALPAPPTPKTGPGWRFPRVGYWRVSGELFITGNGSASTRVRLRGPQTLTVASNVPQAVGEAHTVGFSWVVAVFDDATDAYIEWQQDVAGATLSADANTRVELAYLGPNQAAAPIFNPTVLR